MFVHHRRMATPNVDIQRHLVTLVHLPFWGWLVFNRIVPDARTTSADGCSECGYSTKATSDTCTSSTLCWASLNEKQY